MTDEDLRPPGYVQRYQVTEDEIGEEEAQAIVNGELAQALQQITRSR